MAACNTACNTACINDYSRWLLVSMITPGGPACNTACNITDYARGERPQRNLLQKVQISIGTGKLGKL